MPRHEPQRQSTGERLEMIHAVTAEFDTIFTWDYERSRGRS